MADTEAGPPGILVVDRDEAARRRLRAQLRGLARTVPMRHVAEAGDGAEARRHVDEGGIQIVLLDALLASGSALELARGLANAPGQPQVILIAPSAEIAAASRPGDLADCLLRPVRTERLALALSRATALLTGEAAPTGEDEAGAAFLPVVERAGPLAVPVADVLYLRAEHKYVTVRTREREFLTDVSLAELERRFPDRFVRIHRHTLAAREALAGVEPAAEGHALALHGIVERLPVSRRQRAALQAMLADGSTMPPHEDADASVAARLRRKFGR